MFYDRYNLHFDGVRDNGIGQQVTILSTSPSPPENRSASPAPTTRSRNELYEFGTTDRDHPPVWQQAYIPGPSSSSTPMQHGGQMFQRNLPQSSLDPMTPLGTRRNGLQLFK